MSSESFPTTRVTEERTVVSSVNDSAPVSRDTVSTTTTTLPTAATTSVPSTTSTTSHLADADTSIIPSSTSYLSRNTDDESTSATGTAQQVATNLATAATTVAASAIEGAKNLAGVVYDNAPSKEQVMGTGQAVGSGVGAVGSKAAEMAPSGEQVKDAGAAIGSTAYNTGAAVGSGAYNASAAVGNTAANAGSSAANTVSNTASAVGSTAANAANYIKDTVKEYLPTAVVGSSSSTTLASVDDDKRYFQTSLPSVTDSPVPSSHSKTTTHMLPSQEHTHTGNDVTSLSSVKTHDLATQGGVADIRGEGVPRLPGEYEAGSLATRDDVGRSKSGVGALPGYMGESNVAPIPLGSPKSGADSTASTRTLAGSIAPSSETTTSGSRFERSTHPSTGTNPSTTTAHPSTTSAAATYLSSITHPSTTTTTSHPSTGHDTPPSTTIASAGERLATASAGAGAGHVGSGVGTGVGTGVGSTANTGPYPRTSTTGGRVSGQHPDMPTAPSGPHTGRHAGAVEPRVGNTDTGKDMTKGGKEKVGLKDKIKGEAKVISGKIGGNEEKVEVGKRMMGKN